MGYKFNMASNDDSYDMAGKSGQYEWVVSFRKLRNPCKPAPQAVQPYGGLIIMMMMILIIIMADLNDD